MGTIPTKKSQSEHTHTLTLTLRTAYIATCVTHAYETKLSPQVNQFLHTPPKNGTSSKRRGSILCILQPPHLLPRNQRLHLNLQIQPLWRQIPLHHHLPLPQTRRPPPPLPHQALPIRLSLHHQSRLARRLHALHHRLKVPRRQEAHR